MSKLSSAEGNIKMFHCPACNTAHGVRVGAGEVVWDWNGSMDAPTFTPSILTRFTKITEQGEKELQEWRDAGYPKLEEGFSFPHVDMLCHSYVNNGNIQFLSDCTHALAGQTVPLPEWEAL